jgi:signal transduction histidine kinase
MTFMVTFFGFLNLLSGIIALVLALYILQKKKKGYLRTLSFLFFSAAWWNIVISFEIFSKSIESHLFWSAWAYPGTMCAPVFLFLFLYRYTHFNRTFSKPIIALFFVVPLLSNVFVFYPPWRPFVWSEVTVSQTPWGQIAQYGHGWWYFVEAFYSYVLIAMGIFYLIRGFSLFPQQYSVPMRLMLISSLLPFLLNFIYSLNSSRFYGLDMTPPTFVVSTILFYFTISKHKLLSITPVAWNTVFETVNDGAVVLIEDKIVAINPAARAIMQSVGVVAKEGVRVSQIGKEGNSFVRFYNDQEKVKSEMLIGDRYFEVSKNVISNKVDERSSQTIIFHDITEIKQKETEIQAINQKLQEANATKDMLLKVVSHDLRGPIGTIASYLELYIEDDEPVEKKNLEVLYQTTANASMLMENLLYWAIGQGNKLSVAPAMNSLFDTILRAIEILHYQAANKGVAVNNHCAPDAMAYYDAPTVEMVVRNLISNAIKFSNSQGNIDVEVESSPSVVSVHIKDEGVGISGETIEKILSQATVKSQRGTSDEKGTGIGLPMCQRMIAANKGTFDICSEAGKGTTVSFTLPAQKTV